MTRWKWADLLIGGPYEDNIDLQGIYAAMDDHLDDATNGIFQARNKLFIWDIDAITDPKILDFVADNLGLYGWDKTWNLAAKKLKAKIGVNLKRKAGTVYAIKKAPVFALDPAKFDEVNHPIEVIERLESNYYDGTYLYDGSITYDGGFHWTRFKMIVPYDGTPTQEEADAVETQVNHYKRLVCNLADVDGIVFIRLQNSFAHFRPGEDGYGTIPHDSTLNITGDMSICARLWWEGMSSHGDPLLLGKGEFAPFGGNAALEAAIDAYYACEDDAANTTVVDSTGSHDGTASLNTSNLHTTSGKIDGAFDFSGGATENFTSPIETVPGGVFDVDKSWFISLWLYKPAGTGTYGVLGNIPSGSKGFYVTYVGSSQKIQFYARDFSGGFYRYVQSTALPVGWSFCVIGQLGGDTLTDHVMWLNGVLQTSKGSGGTSLSMASAVPMTFGYNQINGGWPSSLDEIGIASVTAPTQQIVDDLYNSGLALGYGTPPNIPYGLRAPAGSDPLSPAVEFIVNDGSGIIGVSGPELIANEMNTIVVRKNGLNVDFDINGDTAPGTLANHGAGNTDPIQIMRDILNSDSKTYGYLSDLVIYDRVITDTEREEYKAGYGPENVPSGYVGYWRMNEESGTTCAEESGSGLDMTLSDVYWDYFLTPWGGNSTLSDKITSYWPMDENSDVGTVLHDIVGSAHLEGVRVTEDVHVASAKLGAGILNTKTPGDYYFFSEAPSSIEIGQPFSFGIWLKIGNNFSDGRTLLDFYDPDSQTGVFVYLEAITSKINVIFYGGAGIQWTCKTSGASLSIGTEVFYGFSYDGSGVNTGMFTFQDGADDSTRTTTGTMVEFGSGQSGYLFKRNSGLGFDYPDFQYVDGMFWSDQALTETDFEFIYNKALALKWQEEE